MRHSWTSFAASLALLCSSMFAHAAEPAGNQDAYAVYDQYYQRALQAAPYDLTSPRVTLLLPGEPLLTAALSVAKAGDQIDWEVSPGVVAQLAGNLEGMPPEPKDEDYDWYTRQAVPSADAVAQSSAEPAVEPVAETAAAPSSAEFEDSFAYGYEHEYDYGYEDFGYNPHLTPREPAAEVAAEVAAEAAAQAFVAAEAEARIVEKMAEKSADKAAAELAAAEEFADLFGAAEGKAEEVAESLEDIEHLYGFDADGRPIRTGMSEAAMAQESSDYTRGYSVYDDKLADDYLTKYHEMLHGEAFAATPAQSQEPALASQLLEAAQAALAFDWREHALSLGHEALASDSAQDLLAQAEVAWQHLNSGESLSAVLDQGNYEYGVYDGDDYACPSDIAPCYPLVVETEPVSAEPEVAEVDVDTVLQFAETLDRTGVALQEWSLTLSDWACQYEASRLLQSRRSVTTDAR